MSYLNRVSELNPCIRKKRWKITKKELPDRQSKMVGLSCIFIALPSLLCKSFNAMAFICIISSIFSFLADYSFAGNEEGGKKTFGFSIHVIDRWSACFSIAYFLFKLVWTNHVLEAIGLILSLCIGFLYSRNSPTKDSWFFRHTVWHVVLVIVVSRAIIILNDTDVGM
jgi:predicted membrane channel-forming protein YqfA (hemolysin III family)